MEELTKEQKRIKVLEAESRLKLNHYVLKMRQAMNLEDKIKFTQRRIKEWVEHFGQDGVYISFSGGKDSTVLLNIVRGLYSDVEAVFVDTGLEYPEIKQFVNTFENVKIIRPEKMFNKVIQEYGFPIISKEVSEAIFNARKYQENGKTYKRFYEKITGTLKNPNTNELSPFNCSKWRYLLDAPFKISHKCCNVMKKTPAHNYYKQTKKAPIIATMAEESRLRALHYYKSGCNGFENKIPTSMPIAFWTEQDILRYIKTFNIPYASVYGDIVESKDGILQMTGCQRTGCMFCGFGCHLEKQPNRFQKLQKTHPKQYDYIINELGMGKVLDYIGVEYTNRQMTLF